MKRIEILNCLDEMKNSLNLCKLNYFENINKENYLKNIGDINLNIKKIYELQRDEEISFKSKISKVDLNKIKNKLNEIKDSNIDRNENNKNDKNDKNDKTPSIVILPNKSDMLLKGMLINNEISSDFTSRLIEPYKHDFFRDLNDLKFYTSSKVDLNNFYNDCEKFKNDEIFFCVNKAFSIILQNLKITYIFDYKYDSMDKVLKLKKGEKNSSLVYEKLKRELNDVISQISFLDFRKGIYNFARYLNMYKDLFNTKCDYCNKVLKYSQDENTFLPPLVRNLKNKKSYHYFCQFTL